jgi:hypothetical protein
LAAWSAGGNLNTARNSAIRNRHSNSRISFGGYVMATVITAATESYNGTSLDFRSWKLILQAEIYGAFAFGTQTAGLEQVLDILEDLQHFQQQQNLIMVHLGQLYQPS